MKTGDQANTIPKLDEKTVSEVCRETPTAYLKFKNGILMQLWEVETSHKHYIKDSIINEGEWLYSYTFYTANTEWRLLLKE